MRYPTPMQIDMSAMPMILDMQHIGLPADRDHFRNLEDVFTVELAKLEHEVEQYAGGYINVRSHPQVSKLLYGRLGIPKPKVKSKKSGETMTGDEILAQIVDKHPVVELIRRHRMFTKLVTTYVVPVYTSLIRPDGRVYPTYRITQTETGRLSSADPNIQAVPTRTKEGLQIRKGYVPPPGHILVSIDFSGIEMRVLAWLSGDERMVNIFRTGQDIHQQTASWMFGIPLAEVDDKKHRYPAKRIGFGTVYGVSATGLYRQLMVTEGCADWTEDRCQKALDKWFETYPDVKAYMADIASFAIRHGYVEDFVGRRRIVPGAQLKSEQLKARAIRQAGNFPIQGGAAELMKMAMPKINRLLVDLRSRGWFAWPITSVHDELIFELDQDIAAAFTVEAQGIMENIADVSTGLKTDAEWSTVSWGDLTAVWN